MFQEDVDALCPKMLGDPALPTIVRSASHHPPRYKEECLTIPIAKNRRNEALLRSQFKISHALTRPYLAHSFYQSL